MSISLGKFLSLGFYTYPPSTVLDMEGVLYDSTMHCLYASYYCILYVCYYAHYCKLLCNLHNPTDCSTFHICTCTANGATTAIVVFGRVVLHCVVQKRKTCSYYVVTANYVVNGQHHHQHCLEGPSNVSAHRATKMYS